MPSGYRHLTYDQRCQLHTLNARGDSQSQIAKTLCVHKSTISRELSRNRGMRGYRYKQAHSLAIERRKNASKRRRKLTPELILLIEDKLCLQWSPEQISGWLKEKRGERISHEVIYQHIWKDKRKGGKLYKHLRHSGKKYNKRRTGKAGRGCIPNRVDIDERPEIVETKSRLGDWELDTIIGTGHTGVIVSMVERATKLTKLVKLSRNTAKGVSSALLEKLLPLQEHVLTLTADNGREFANHEMVGRGLKAGFFFAKPYHSWERGLNEHTNGLVRQYFPKNMPFDKITQNQLEEVEDLLNNRPRKVLKYRSPIEAFEEMRRKSSVVALHS